MSNDHDSNHENVDDSNNSRKYYSVPFERVSHPRVVKLQRRSLSAENVTHGGKKSEDLSPSIMQEYSLERMLTESEKEVLAHEQKFVAALQPKEIAVSKQPPWVLRKMSEFNSAAALVSTQSDSHASTISRLAKSAKASAGVSPANLVSSQSASHVSAICRPAKPATASTGVVGSAHFPARRLVDQQPQPLMSKIIVLEDRLPKQKPLQRAEPVSDGLALPKNAGAGVTKSCHRCPGEIHSQKYCHRKMCSHCGASFVDTAHIKMCAEEQRRTKLQKDCRRGLGSAEYGDVDVPILDGSNAKVANTEPASHRVGNRRGLYHPYPRPAFSDPCDYDPRPERSNPCDYDPQPERSNRYVPIWPWYQLINGCLHACAEDALGAFTIDLQI